MRLRNVTERDVTSTVLLNAPAHTVRCEFVGERESRRPFKKPGSNNRAGGPVYYKRPVLFVMRVIYTTIIESSEYRDRH